jgi:hypothetical protein
MSHKEEKLHIYFFYWEMYRKDHYIYCLWHLCDSVIEAEANLGNFSTFCLNLSDSWKPSYQNGSPINRFNPATCLCLFQARSKIYSRPWQLSSMYFGRVTGRLKRVISIVITACGDHHCLTFIFICINCLYHYTILFSIDGITKQFIYSFISWM